MKTFEQLYGAVYDQVDNFVDNHPVVATGLAGVTFLLAVLTPLAITAHTPEIEQQRGAVRRAVLADGFTDVKYITPLPIENDQATASVWVGNCEIDRVTLKISAQSGFDVVSYTPNDQSAAVRRNVLPLGAKTVFKAQELAGMLATQNCQR